MNNWLDCICEHLKLQILILAIVWVIGASFFVFAFINIESFKNVDYFVVTAYFNTLTSFFKWITITLICIVIILIVLYKQEYNDGKNKSL